MLITEVRSEFALCHGAFSEQLNHLLVDPSLSFSFAHHSHHYNTEYVNTLETCETRHVRECEDELWYEIASHGGSIFLASLAYIHTTAGKAFTNLMA